MISLSEDQFAWLCFSDRKVVIDKFIFFSEVILCGCVSIVNICIALETVYVYITAGLTR